MSGTLYGKECRGMWKLLAIFCGVLALYSVAVVAMFDPELGNALAEFEKVMPGMMAAMGMTSFGTELVEFLASYLYGMLFTVFPLVFIVLTANRLVVRYVDSGAMALLLATPTSRRTIVTTQAAVLLTGVLALLAVTGGVLQGTAEALFPGKLDLAAFWTLNGGLACFHLALCGWCFFISCVCNEVRRAVALGAGVPVLGFLLQMLANLGGGLERLKYLTPWSLFAPRAILAGEGWVPAGLAALAAAGVVLLELGIWRFCRRDLPL